MASSDLSYAQLEALWEQAGGDASMAPLMAAIAEAESSGNPDALNATDNHGTQSSFGLWQISTGTHTPPAPNWDVPLENADLALGKYNSQGLGAWGTYTSGAYRQFLQSGVTPSSGGLNFQAGTNPDGTTSSTGTTSGTGSGGSQQQASTAGVWGDFKSGIGDIFGALGGAVAGPEKVYTGITALVSELLYAGTWVRLGEIILGGALLAGGMVCVVAVLGGHGGSAGGSLTKAANGVVDIAQPEVGLPATAARGAKNDLTKPKSSPKRQTSPNPSGRSHRQNQQIFRSKTGVSSAGQYGSATELDGVVDDLIA